MSGRQDAINYSLIVKTGLSHTTTVSGQSMEGDDVMITTLSPDLSTIVTSGNQSVGNVTEQQTTSNATAVAGQFVPNDVILAPFWSFWVAMLVVLLLIAGLCYFFYRFMERDNPYKQGGDVAVVVQDKDRVCKVDHKKSMKEREEKIRKGLIANLPVKIQKTVGQSVGQSGQKPQTSVTDAAQTAPGRTKSRSSVKQAAKMLVPSVGSSGTDVRTRSSDDSSADNSQI